MGTAIVLCLVLGGGVGYLLDDVAHTAPILTFVGLALGVAAAVSVTVSHVRRFLR
jgi:F0F1-type ATP synthase assembly protein I